MGVPKIRIIVYWGLYGGPLVLRHYHVGARLRKYGKRGLEQTIAGEGDELVVKDYGEGLRFQVVSCKS